MAEQFNSKRVFLPRGQQRDFLDQVLKKISLKETAKLSGVSERTIRDWYREKFTMNYKAMIKLCEETNILIPKNLKLKDRYWYASLGAKAGAQTTFKKYGRVPVDEKYRKKKWRDWWEKDGQYKNHPIINKAKKIRRPRKSKWLAEYVGIILGDGGINPYQVTVTLNRDDDKEYVNYVTQLTKKLFRVPVTKHESKSDLSVTLVVSRIELVRFCVDNLGLVRGNKVTNQVRIPEWIKSNKKYASACVRGLVDTDGSIITHTYLSANKKYSYKKLNYTSRSKPLLKDVRNILLSHCIRTRLARHYDLWIDAQSEIERYMNVIGTNNPKHLNRYKK